MLLHRDLERAIESGNLEQLKGLLILADRPDVPHTFLDDGNYVMIAIETRNPEIVQALLDAGADINQQDEDGWTPLMFATLEGYFDIVKVLLDAGADVNIESPEGEYALYIAAYSGHQEIFDYLAPLTTSDLRQDAEQCLVEALRKRQQREVVKPGVRGLIKAAAEGNITKVRRAIETGVNINSFDEVGETALRAAVVRNHLEIVQLLIEAGADVNAVIQGMTVLHHAAMFSNSEIVQYLIRAGADINRRDADGFTPLMRTATSPYDDREDVKQAFRQAGASETELPDN